MGKIRSCIAAALPLAWVTVVTFVAAAQKIFSPNPKIGFLSASRSLESQLGSSSLNQAHSLVVLRTQFNLRVDAVVASLFLILVAAIVLISIKHWIAIGSGKDPGTLRESPIVRLPGEQLLEDPSHGFGRSIQGAGLFILALARQVVGESARPTGEEQIGNESFKSQAAQGNLGRNWADHVKQRSSQPRCC